MATKTAAQKAADKAAKKTEALIDGLKAAGVALTGSETPEEIQALADKNNVKVLTAKEAKAAKAAAGTASGGPQAHIGKAERMRLHLEAQPKVAIMIPLSQGEAAGSTESVILNGYRLNIRKGEYVYVPEQVARVIMESQQQTAAAIENYFLMNSDGKSKAMKQKELNS